MNIKIVPIRHKIQYSDKFSREELRGKIHTGVENVLLIDTTNNGEYPIGMMHIDYIPGEFHDELNKGKEVYGTMEFTLEEDVLEE